MHPTAFELVNYGELKDVAFGHDEEVVRRQVDHLDVGVDFWLDEALGAYFLGQPVDDDDFVFEDEEVEVLAGPEVDSTEVLADLLAWN